MERYYQREIETASREQILAWQNERLVNTCLLYTSMAVTLNKDAEMVESIRQGLKRTGGYCPCRVQRTEENKCICQEFRQQIADPSFEGYCHCMLYYKSKD